jgi:hypothetical protein
MFVDLKTKKELLYKKEEIFHLFLASFGRKMSYEDWYWFYIDNPVGEPYVSLYYEKGKLLGHYAVLPTLMTYGGGSFVAYRSMTTMVHPDGRGKGLFTELAKRVYSMLESDRASLVYGFPNDKSAPGFVRNLGWTLLKSDHVCDFAGEEIIKNESIQAALFHEADIAWDATNYEQAKWRCSIPGYSIEKFQGLILKEYQGVFNILHIDRSGLKEIQSNRYYRILIPSDVSIDVAGLSSVFDYQFGYRIFNNIYTGAKFKREFLMSDVF